jgi:hypothetical protein
MVLSKYGTAMRRRHWQLAQAMAPNLLSRLELVPGISHPDLTNLKAPYPKKNQRAAVAERSLPDDSHSLK